MKRDPRLHGLSSDHHHALLLARALMQGSPAAWTPEQGAALGARFDTELEPHFRVEEELLLPALHERGRTDLDRRTRADHTTLRVLVSEARAGVGEAAVRFGQLLHEHVRFEEAELFPACEALVPPAMLDEVARRAPKHP